MSRWILIGGSILCLTVCPAEAQDLDPFGDRPSFDLHGVVLDVGTDVPVRGARIAVPELGLQVPVDSMGAFVISGMPQGRFTFVTTAFGYFDNVEQSVVAEASVLLVRLAAAPFDVEGLTVVVSETTPAGLAAVDQQLERRRLRTGLLSRVSTRDDLLGSTAQTAFDLLRERHFMFLQSCPREDLGEPRCVLVRGGLRRVSVYVDDMTAPISTIYSYDPTHLYRVEFYPSLGHVRLITMRYATHMAMTGWSPRPICLVC